MGGGQDQRGGGNLAQAIAVVGREGGSGSPDVAAVRGVVSEQLPAVRACPLHLSVGVVGGGQRGGVQAASRPADAADGNYMAGSVTQPLTAR